MLRVPKIAVFSADDSFPSRRLLEALSQLYSVEFVRTGDLLVGAYDAALLFGTTRDHAIRTARSGLRCMAFLCGESVNLSSTCPDVHLASIPYLNSCLRSQVLPDTALQSISRMKEEVGDQVVARKDRDALWIHRAEGTSAVDFVAMAVPTLLDGHHLYPHLQKDNWIRLLPLLHFLREVSRWEFPPIRACFMFDDPNLHWRSYGYIRFHQLLEHARQHNYHVSFATVPLDSWYVHPETATLFRENAAQLSLLIHGNNHTYYELMQSGTDDSRTALASQALRRIEHLEGVAGARVSRVMAAPHGACDHRTANALMRTGFEAACISRSSLMARNPSTAWSPTAGLNPAEFLGEGLPIIPRFNIRWDAQTCVRFAAFLGQPVIPVGHHDDLANGLDLMKTLAALINSIGEVQWSDMKSIAQTNFFRHRDGEALHLRTFSRRIRLKVPAEVRSLSIHRVWLSGNLGEGLTVTRPGSPPERVDHYHGEPLAVTPGEEVVISSVHPDLVDPHTVVLSHPSLWAIVRRQLCEGRDRLKPITAKLTSIKN